MLGKGSLENDDEDMAPSWLDTSNDRTFAVSVSSGLGRDDGDGDNDDHEHHHDKEPLLLLSRQSSHNINNDIDDTDDDDDEELGMSTTPATMEVDDHDGTPQKKTRNGKNNNKDSKKKQSIVDIWSQYGTMMKKKKNKRHSSLVDDDDDNNNDFQDATNVSQNRKLPERPTRSCGLRIFIVIEVYALLTCLGLLVSQILPMVLTDIHQMDPVEIALKIYVCIFSFIFMVVEFDPPFIPFIRRAAFLQAYLSRGFLYTFLSLVCLEEAYSERVTDMLLHPLDEFHIAWFPLYLQISAWCVCALGILYFLMGIFCLKRLRDRLYREDRQKWKAYRERQKQHWEENPFH